MKQKIFCPYCGRCLGECSANDESGSVEILKSQPKHIKTKQLIHDMKCVKCKEQVFIVLELKD